MTANDKKILSMAFLFLIFIGLCGGTLGIIILPVAKDFGIDSSQVAATFSVFSLGSTAFIFATTGVILNFLSVRQTVILDNVLLGLGALSIFLAQGLDMFYAAMLFFGFGVGMSFSLGQYFVIAKYGGKERNSKISLVNAFYTVGSVTSPVIGSYLIHKLSVPWEFIFTGTALVVLLNLVLASVTDFSDLEQTEAEETAEEEQLSFKDRAKERAQQFWEEFRGWPATVWILVIALICYSLSEVTFTTWLVPYSQKGVGIDPVIAGKLMSTFWLFVGVGRFLASYFLKKFRAEFYLGAGSALAAITVFAFVMLGDAISGYIALGVVALMGLSFSALLNVIESYGTLQVKGANKALATLFVGMGSLGPVIAPIVSSAIKDAFGFRIALTSSGLWMTVVVTLIIVTFMVNKKRGYDPHEATASNENPEPEAESA